MLSVLDIILISLGGIAVVIYAFFKIRQVVKFRKAVKQYIADGMTEIQARETAYNQYYKKQKKNDDRPNTDNDTICED